jgi:deazaflavin-dependent oxidoreductase (nitroreductase family)
MRVINPFVSAILHSPFHRFLSKSVLLLTITGRRSGRRYTTPVGYTREGDTVTVFSSGHTWCTNLRGGAAVAVWLGGRGRTGRAELIEDRARVLDEVWRYLTRFGPRDGGQRIGIGLDERHPPSPEQLASALEGHVVIRLTLDPTPEG